MKRGDVYLLTHEEYADYGILGIIRALKDFDFDAEIVLFKDLCDRNDQENQGVYSYAGFFDRLIASGLCELAGIHELHLGSYGRLERRPEADLLRRIAERDENGKGGQR